MNEKKPNPASASDPEPAVAQQNPTQNGRRGLRPALIGAGAALAVLLIGGAGTAIGAAIADEDDDRVAVTSGGDPSTSGDDAGTGSETTGSGSSNAAGTTIAADAASLADAIAAAVAAVPDASGATSIEVERDGWDVDIARTDGTETDVHVAVDGTIAVRGTDTDTDTDTDTNVLLDTDDLAGVVEAARDAADAGSVESISTDDDRDPFYEVTIDHGNGDDTDIELAEDLTVIAVDTDD